MSELKTAEALARGREIRSLLEQGEPALAFDLVEPLLGRRVHFAMLDRVAREFGKAPFDQLDAFLEMLAQHGAIGSWPLIGTALAEQLGSDLSGALERERTLIQIGNVWYAADAVGERTAGPALVQYFDATLEHFQAWRADENRWVRRSIGVAVHVWAKRDRGTDGIKAKRILKLLEPLWDEREIDAVKGIGWGLKTIGRYYPELMRDWLKVQTARPYRALMMHKARTYLSP